VTDPLLNQLMEHLAFLGYSNPPIPGPPPSVEVINATHSTKMPFWVLLVAGGAFFRALYNLSDAAKQDRNGSVAFANQLNAATLLSHYYIIEDYIFCSAWYYGSYEQRRVGMFLDRFFYENSLPHRQFRDQAELYMGPARYV